MGFKNEIEKHIKSNLNSYRDNAFVLRPLAAYKRKK